MNENISYSSPRKCAVEILVQVLDQKRPFDEAVARHNAFMAMSERDRNFARLMIMTVLRRLGQIDDILSKMLAKPLVGKTQDVMHCLRLGVVQLVWLETPAHAAVHAMVDTVAECGHERMKGLVNVVLKRVAKEGKELLSAQDEARINAPFWLYDAWIKTYGEEIARAIATPSNTSPPLDITVKGDAEKWAKALGGVLLPTGSVRLQEAGKVTALSGYDEGQWWVQDTAAMLPVTLLGNIKDKTVFDLCAAPGGKTAQLAAGGANVIAVDQSKRRLQIVEENLKRLKLSAELIESDILKWKPSVFPDAILLDAPCSATGTIRRHPEVIYHRKKEDIAELVLLQKRMLNRAAEWLKPGGIMVYCVCSLQPEEGELQIESFLATHPFFKLKKIDGVPAEFITKQGTLRTTPANYKDTGGMDGFYAALLEKIV